ncbi:hypothetical protein K461DRAFT_281566 [Myriangium duriaei CBS 260.36]|uniref:Uncharacterized protein n=1 Tax=Myriangium duriaei CBS 260.36 TaxID=1168546 RepID=A0A9P4IUX3_9PEZI|nr:hypothetical protein K461DRAFT_281566 [Myriangium duriaei CBS 260.36]
MDSAAESNGLHPPADRTPVVTPSKRALSDTFPALAPSPQFREAAAASKDDSAIIGDPPRTPQQTSFLSRGLSLQMPHKNAGLLSSPSGTPNKPPLSPQLDPTMTYGSPATSLPRHSRGLDWARASTNLHHSTLAESSPDSSPIITQRSLAIPSRKGSINSMMLDSPNLGPTGSWPAFLNSERSAMSSSVGSVNMLGSPTGSSESDDEDLSEDNDELMCTPQANRMIGINIQTPYNPSNVTQSPSGGNWSNNFSPAAASLMKNFQRGRFKRGRSRKSSSSASGQSAIPSPRNTSPPPIRSIESANGYFGWNKFSSSRRESLALGTDQLHLSSSNDSGDENKEAIPTTPGVVRRAVTRRGNLLPKTKGFARVRAALAEESAPVDTDVRREAETIKQVRERETPGARSPGLLPAIPGLEHPLEDVPEEANFSLTSQTDHGESKGINTCFSTHAAQNANSSYWNRMDKSFRTPPPPSFPRTSSSAADMTMDSPCGESFSGNILGGQSAQDAIPSSEITFPSVLTKIIGKRARDEDVEMSIKRRAVSPSLSVTNSPVVGQSPRESAGSGLQARDRPERADGWGGPPKATRDSSSGGEQNNGLRPHRSNSGGSVSSMAGSVGPKRVGLQSMTDTNDGLMKMSIE